MTEKSSKLNSCCCCCHDFDWHCKMVTASNYNKHTYTCIAAALHWRSQINCTTSDLPKEPIFFSAENKNREEKQIIKKPKTKLAFRLIVRRAHASRFVACHRSHLSVSFVFAFVLMLTFVYRFWLPLPLPLPCAMQICFYFNSFDIASSPINYRLSVRCSRYSNSKYLLSMA